MEKTTTVTETFEWCHFCKAFDAVTEKVYIDGLWRAIEEPLKAWMPLPKPYREESEVKE